MVPSGGLRVLPGMCCSLGGEGGGDAAPAYPCLSLPVPKLSLRAAVGLRHNLTHGEKGGAGEHRVHAQLGFQLRTSPPGPGAAPTSPRGSQSLKAFSCVKEIGFGAIGLFSVALSAFIPAYIIAIALPVCPPFAPALAASFPPLRGAGLLPPLMARQHQAVGNGQVQLTFFPSSASLHCKSKPGCSASLCSHLLPARLSRLPRATAHLWAQRFAPAPASFKDATPAASL